MTAEFTPVNKTRSWSRLQAHRAAGLVNLREHAGDRQRAKALSIRTPHLFYDYSRQLATRETVRLLIDLAKERDLKGQIQAMFSGKRINVTEDRAVLHTALRNLSGPHARPEVLEVLEKIMGFTQEVFSGKRLGVTGKKLMNIVVVAIGGSYLGPNFLAEACESFTGRTLRFIANVDGTDFARQTDGLDPAETLFIIASKTFTTAETMKNALTCKRWMQDKLGNSSEVISKHFVAVSTARDKVEDFGINPDNMFVFWDWVGGRFSATSAVGMLPLSLYLGHDVAREILEGAHWMDEHFRTAPFEQNLCVIPALIDIWNINFLGLKIRALLPYCQALVELARHTQQVEMESNGKRVDLLGREVDFDTGEVVFGEPGTNSQHSFFQPIHQGTLIIPCDLIGFLMPLHNVGRGNIQEVTHHEELMANLFAQANALAFGKDDPLPHKRFPGNRPSSTLLLEKLTPFTAGMLLAWTEHRAAVKGFVWGIDSFDQFGVELGKVLAVKIRQELLHHYQDPSYMPKTGNPSTDLMLRALVLGNLPD